MQKKSSAFRMWVTELWFQNKEERLLHSEASIKMEEYFQRYKYWLKREYKHQQK